MHAEIQQVRRFNRLVSQRAGTLDASYLGRGRPLGEARLLFEIGHGGDIRTLRERLGLDSGYFSRLLRALEAQGLITVAPSETDRRVRDIQLTSAGRAEVAVYDRLSDDLAASILAPLDDTQRRRLTAAMAEVERLLRASSVTVTTEPSDTADARRCVAHYIEELNRLFDAGFDPNGSPADHDDFLPPHGVFLVARLDGQAIGCGGLKSLDVTTGEIKRLWIAPEARGLGLGRRLVRLLEDHARGMGLNRVLLDTNRALTAARALYLGEGYAEVPPYNDNPYADHWFAKDL